MSQLWNVQRPKSNLEGGIAITGAPNEPIRCPTCCFFRNQSALKSIAVENGS